MSVLRACGLFGALTLVAVLLVHLRAEQIRCAARILAIESQWVQQRRELWTLQTRSARLLAPQRLGDRVETGPSGLIPPGSKPMYRRRPQLAARRP